MPVLSPDRVAPGPSKSGGEGPPGERLSPRQRLELLCDAGSFRPIRTRVVPLWEGQARRAGDGVLAGTGEVDGRPVFCYAQDATFAGGSLGQVHADSIVRVLELAQRAGAPVVGFASSGGARIQEGVSALGAYARVFRRTVALSGRVPQISIVSGVSAGGGAYSPALTDWLIMTRGSTMFLTGPGVVREAMGEDVTPAALGGERVHRRNGVCHLVADDEHDAGGLARALLGYLPARSRAAPPLQPPVPPAAGDPGDVVPLDSQAYDIRDVIARVVDGGHLFEVSSGWARNIVTGFARLQGRSVGILANQPRWLGGVLDSAGSQKAARHVAQCDRFGIPLLVLVDTPGFLPGVRQEREGVIRFGAGLVHAFAAATVPRITLIIRKAFGGAFIAMNSRELGADYVFAWPQAQIGVMSARSAVGVIHRRTLAGADGGPELQRDLEALYAREHLSADVAAASGQVDELIEPRQTRAVLIQALGSIDENWLTTREEAR